MFEFAGADVELFGAADAARGLFALPSDPGRFLCISDVETTFASGSALTGFTASGIARLPACGAAIGAAWHDQDPVHNVTEPVCDDVVCRADFSSHLISPPSGELILIRAGGDAPPTMSHGDYYRSVKIAASLLIDFTGDGLVHCGGGGKYTTETWHEFAGDGLTGPTHHTYSVDLDWLDSDHALSCPGDLVAGSLNGVNN